MRMAKLLAIYVIIRELAENKIRKENLYGRNIGSSIRAVESYEISKGITALSRRFSHFGANG